MANRTVLYGTLLCLCAPTPAGAATGVQKPAQRPAGVLEREHEARARFESNR
jgi:hypothetical protein